MAVAKRSRLGGYDCQFVHDPPPVSLCCGVCALPYREPHLLNCCGKKICQLCIRPYLDGKPCCPFCDQVIKSLLLDKELRSNVLDLAVYCTHREDGCKWSGELRGLEAHLNSVCPVVICECRYACGKCFPRSTLNTHEMDLCPNRPLEVKFASFQREVSSQFAKYEFKIAQLEAQLFCPPCKLTMSCYYFHKNAKDRWFSPPFYDRPGGYKFCIKVNTNGGSEGTGSHVSMYVYLMKGLNDDRLVWPFQGSIEIQLVNQKKQNKCVVVEFDKKAAAKGIASREMSEDIRDVGLGFSQFVSHRRVEETTERSQYLLDDCLIFIVTKIHVAVCTTH